MKVYQRALLLCLCLFLLFSQSAIASDNKNNTTEDTPLSPQDLQQFVTAIHQVKSYYVDPVNNKKLLENAIRGMVEGLDPHSTYLDAQDFRELQDATSGEFTGLGLEVMMDEGYIKVVSPIDDTPAQRAGIKAGDLIVRIDSAPVKGMLLRDAINKMRGKAGTHITLTVFHKDELKPAKIKITRELIKIQSVKSQMLDKGFAYVRVSTFQANTPADLIKAIQKLKEQAKGRLKGLILDLRNDPGGLLDSAVDITNIFLDSDKLANNKLIVYTKGRVAGAQYTAKATGSDVLSGIPMVVLINEGSASGSEIVAGALQDYKRAVIVGTNSFGKGSVQTVLPLSDNSALKLTTALYYTPGGRSIQAKGIRPDIVVEPIDWPGTSKEKQRLDALKEMDLLGHLNNGNAPSSNKDDDTDAINKIAEPPSLSTLPSPKTDYQLNQALTLLKALAAIKK